MIDIYRVFTRYLPDVNRYQLDITFISTDQTLDASGCLLDIIYQMSTRYPLDAYGRLPHGRLHEGHTSLRQKLC